MFVREEPSWYLEQRISDWTFAKRPDKLCYDISRQTGRKDITEGFYSAHEERFTKGHERSLSSVKANSPHIPSVNIKKFANRTDASMYSCVGDNPGSLPRRIVN